VSSLVRILINKRFDASGLPEPPVSEGGSMTTRRKQLKEGGLLSTTAV